MSNEAAEAILAYLGDVHRDLESFEGEEALAEGYGYALHNARQMYIEYSGNFECDCEDMDVGLAEEMSGGEWKCAECGALLVAAGDEVAA